MIRYVQVASEQIPLGVSALLLFIEKNELCAGVIEHHRDGSFERRVPADPVPADVVPVICQLMARSQSEILHVVLEAAAYWPEQFPTMSGSA